MRSLLCITLLFVAGSAIAQDYSAFSQTLREFYHPDTAKVNEAWVMLEAAGNIPLVVEDSVAFLYRGPASSVSWMGDFNGWGYNRAFKNHGQKIPGTDIWILKASFPKDARLDYKIVVDEKNWILDPANTRHQWSGVGGGSPNSELRMPEWKADPITISPVDNLQRGTVYSDLLFNSKKLGYQVTYSIYTPHGYDKNTTYPVVYVTDGYEYMHEKMGNMVLVLDNLIFLKKIKPVIAVFIDHREPVNRANNRRMQELAMNDKYLAFLTEELVPHVGRNYSATSDPRERAILGTSMGGLTAAYFAFSRPDVFGLAGIQSPAFWFRPEIYKVCADAAKPPVKTIMTTGLINDTEEGARKMKAILDQNTCTYEYMESAQGHSWGNWRDLIDDILVYFYQ